MYPATTTKVRYGQHRLFDTDFSFVDLQLPRGGRKFQNIPPNSYLEEWGLPGHGEAYADCGKVNEKHYCPTCGEYKHELRKSCNRASCPTCYRNWLSRETRSATTRVHQGLYLLRELSTKHLLHHVVWSVPPSEYHLSFQEQRKRFHYRRKVAGSIAGLMIYHPYRFRAVSDGRIVAWKHCSLNLEAEAPVVDSYAVYAPHFHTLSVGYLMDSDKFEKRFGWVYKKLHHERPIWSKVDMRGVIWYQLSHAGINPKFQALTWYGKFSTNQLVVLETTVIYETVTCPDCGDILQRCLFNWRHQEWVMVEDVTLKITKKHYIFKSNS